MPKIREIIFEMQSDFNNNIKLIIQNQLSKIITNGCRIYLHSVLDELLSEWEGMPLLWYCVPTLLK